MFAATVGNDNGVSLINPSETCSILWIKLTIRMFDVWLMTTNNIISLTSILLRIISTGTSLTFSCQNGHDPPLSDISHSLLQPPVPLYYIYHQVNAT